MIKKNRITLVSGITFQDGNNLEDINLGYYFGIHAIKFPLISLVRKKTIREPKTALNQSIIEIIKKHSNEYQKYALSRKKGFYNLYF